MENYEQEGYLNIARLISQKNDIQLSFRKDFSATDGRTINVSSRYKNNREKVYALLSHEAGHIGYFSFINMIQKAKQKVSRRYGLDIKLVHEMTNALEDCRIDLTNKEIFPGFYKMLAKLYKELEDKKKKGYTVRDFLGDLIYYVQGLGTFPYAEYKMKKEEMKKLEKIKKVMTSGLSPSKTVVSLNLLADILSRNKENIEKSGNTMYDEDKKSDNNIDKQPANLDKTKKEIMEKADEIAEKVSEMSDEDIEKLAHKMIGEETEEEEEGYEEEKSSGKGNGKGKEKEEEKEEDNEKGSSKGTGKNKEDEGESNNDNSGENDLLDDLDDFEIDITDLVMGEYEKGKEEDSESKWINPDEVKRTLEEIEAEFNDFEEETEGMVKDAILKITYGARSKINEGTVRNVEEVMIENADMRKTIHHSYSYDDDLTPTNEIISKNLILIKKMENFFKTIKVSRNVRGRKNGRLNTSVVRTIATDYRYDRCFTKKQRVEDPKITLMVDISGSMGGRKLNVAKTSMVLLAESLKDVCDLRIVLFCGQYDALNIVVKDFGKPINISNFDMFNRHNHQGSNIDGASVKFEAVKNKRGVIIVVSDGQPAGSSYGLQEAAIDMADARKLVKKIFAFSIDARGDYLDKLYPMNYTNVRSDKPMELTSKMLNFAKKVIVNLIK